MLRRTTHAAFAPDAYVFPGGALDTGDYAVAMLQRIIGISVVGGRARLHDRPGKGARHGFTPLTDAQRVGLIVAAARELYEEAGVLRIVHKDGSPIGINPAAAHALQSLRPLVARGERSFADVLEKYDAYVNADAFVYFSHWITPESEERRYDTYFFLSVAGAEQDAQADASETHDGVWIAPATALERYEAGTFAMIYPTVRHLERLRTFAKLDDLITYARKKDVIPVMPTIGPDDTIHMDEGEAEW